MVFFRTPQRVDAWVRRSVLLAALFAAPPGLAQDAAPQAEAPAAEAPAQTEGVPQPDWEKVCGTVNEAQECHISRRRLAATGQPLAQVMVIERPEKIHLQISVPPVALIQPGIKVAIDNGEPVTVRYAACVPSECIAMGEINKEFIDKLKRGGTLLVSMLNPQGKTISFDISLKGFTASYDGPGIDPAVVQERQQRLEDELKRKADEARQQLLDAQQQQQSSAQGQ
jgi:invasion protein IalB